MTLRSLLFASTALVLICSFTVASPPKSKEPTQIATVAGKPELIPIWKKSAICLPADEDLFYEKNAGANSYIARLYDQVIKDSRDRTKPLVPPAVPVVTKGLVIYLNDIGMVARSLTKRDDIDPKCVAGELFYHAERTSGLWNMAETNGSRQMLNEWLKGETASGITNRIVNRTLSHLCVIDTEFGYFVDDIGLLPAPSGNDDFPGALRRNLFGRNLRRSLLRKVVLDSGKLKIYVGEKSESDKIKSEHFLSVPLVERSTWYFVSEREGVVRLSKLDAQKHNDTWWAIRNEFGGDDRALTASRVWEVELAKPPVPMPDDTRRRPHAIHVLRIGTTLIAPTNLGRVVAVDSITGKIQWTHEYAPLDARRFLTFAPEWVVVPPAVVGDKYIYAPADFPELLCLNAANGKKVWSIKKGDGLYPAVVGEQVLVIGEKTLRALNLKDGIEKWKLDLPGVPCGRGAILGDSYLVPVSDLKAWRGMIAIVDVKSGKISEVLKPDKDEPIGNLVVHQEFLISQTLTEIAVYPIKRN